MLFSPETWIGFTWRLPGSCSVPDPWKGDMRGAGQPGESPNMNSLPLQQSQLYPSSGAPRSRLLPFQAECLAGTLLHVPCPGAPPALCLPRCRLIAAVHHDSLLLASGFFLPWLKKSPSRPHFSVGCVSSFPSSPSCHPYSISSP